MKNNKYLEKIAAKIKTPFVLSPETLKALDIAKTHGVREGKLISKADRASSYSRIWAEDQAFRNHAHPAMRLQLNRLKW